MEYQQEQLRQEAGHDNAQHSLDSNQEAPVEAANAVVKCQSRNAAEQKGRCIDNMGSKVEDLGAHDDVDGEDVLDVDKMSA